MFEIRLDRLVDKWSGSIEVGVTIHNPGSWFIDTLADQMIGLLVDWLIGWMIMCLIE